MNKKLLLFDFDGTIADNSDGILNCVKYSLGKLGKEVPDAETLRKFIGPSLYFSYNEFIEKNDENAHKFVEGYRERYAPIGTTEVRLYPRVKEMLTALENDGYVLAVVSGKPRSFVMKISESLGIFNLFSAYFAPELADHSSDKSHRVIEAMEHFGFDRADTLMIGDTKWDVEAAKGAGVDSLAVTYGFGTVEELRAAGETLLADSVPGIYETITGRTL